jgi:alanyl-tRNA synthetase
MVSDLRGYYDDCYTSHFTAQIVEAFPEKSGTSETGVPWRVRLNKTFFYPESGGQPFDLGTLDGFPVEQVIAEDDQIDHLVRLPAGSELLPGRTVDCLINWDRRFDHMQQHTGQHLLSAVFLDLFGYKTLSFHMGEQVSTIELDAAQLTETQVDSAERQANMLVAEARSVTIAYEDASATVGLRKASSRTGILRIITITDYDRSACGGTHVRTTAEIGSIQIRNLDKVRGHVRLEFVCGGRSRRQARQDFQTLSALSRAASVPASALVEHVRNMQMRLESTEKSLQKANLLLAQAEGKRLYDETAAGGDGIRRRMLLVSEVTESVRAIALAFASHSRAVAAIVPDRLPGTVILASSPNSGLNVGTVWKTTFASGGGRGGGSGTLAQGAVSEPAALDSLLKALGMAESPL